tara:strand:+ start:503 stop:874 length:372 start_codon:yes stop_codon:yes gene_type:complete
MDGYFIEQEIAYDGEYHKCKEPIECYAIDSLYSYEHTGYSIEAYSGCELENSPFKKENDDAVRETVRELNRSYYTYKTDIFIERIYERVYGGSGQSAVKKYSRNDLLEKLEEWSNKIEEGVNT